MKSSNRTSRPLRRMPTPDEIAKVMNYVKIVDGHWIWLGGCSGAKGNYPVMRYDGGLEYVGRWMVQVFRGALPTGMHAGHDHALGCPAKCVCPWHIAPQDGYENRVESNKRNGPRGAAKGRKRTGRNRVWPVFDEQKDLLPDTLVEDRHLDGVAPF